MTKHKLFAVFELNSFGFRKQVWLVSSPVIQIISLRQRSSFWLFEFSSAQPQAMISSRSPKRSETLMENTQLSLCHNISTLPGSSTFAPLVSLVESVQLLANPLDLPGIRMNSSTPLANKSTMSFEVSSTRHSVAEQRRLTVVARSCE